MRILIIAHYYPPLNQVASGRPYSWSKYWTLAGHDVHVLTTKKHPNDGSPTYVPDNDVLPVKGIKALNYWPYKASSNDHFASKRINHTSNNSFYYLLKGLSNIRAKILPLPTLKIQWIFPAVSYATQLFKSWPYELVVSTFDPIASHIIGSLIKKRLPVFWVADYRDLWTGRHLSYQPYFVYLLFKSLEKHFLDRADLLTTVSDPLRTQLTSLLHKPALTIPNGFDPDDFRQSHNRVFPRNGKIRIVYTGSFHKNKQNPIPLFTAISTLKRLSVPYIDNFEVVFYGRKSEYLTNLIHDYGISDKVRYGGFVDRQTCLQIQKEANALLFLGWNDRFVDGILTGKLFEYVSSGTPILSIGNLVPDSADKIIDNSGTGFVLGQSVEKTIHILKKVINNETLKYNPNKNYIKMYHRKYLANKMLKNILYRMNNDSKFNDNNSGI